MVSLEHYLDTSYSPDREFVDGVVVERDVGERPHSRVPDLCVTLSDPREDVLTRPPFLCVEILQRESATDLFEKLGEYGAMGVPHVWVIDPRTRHAFTYVGSKRQRITAPSLSAGDISIPLEEVFFHL